MGYAQRNSLIIGIVLLLFLSAVSYSYFKKHKQVKLLKTNYEEKYTLMERVKNNLPKKDEDGTYHSYFKNWDEITNPQKYILNEDNTIKTTKYLNDLCLRFAPGLRFDLQYSKSDKLNTVNYNEYIITGDGTLGELYAFIFNIENQPPLYTIDTFSASESPKEKGVEPSEEQDKIRFTFVLRGYFKTGGKEQDKLALLSWHVSANKPFKQRIHEPIDDPHENEYLDPDAATLIAITAQSILLKNNSGKIFRLQVGDKVAYGYLQKIDFSHQEVIFMINKIGVPYKKIISISKDKV